jgi:hypothetical protein
MIEQSPLKQDTRSFQRKLKWVSVMKTMSDSPMALRQLFLPAVHAGPAASERL